MSEQAEHVQGLVDRMEAIAALADEAESKGQALQEIPELRLVGNAYVGMAQRIREALGEST